MRNYGYFLVMAMVILPLGAEAAIPAEYTMANIFTATHDAPQSFAMDERGDFFGITETGKQFSQVVVESTDSVRLQKFSIDSAYFYMSDKGLIEADSDLAALSIYLTLV